MKSTTSGDESNSIKSDSLLLAKKQLETIPFKILDKCKNIKYCYMEGNHLTELPDRFFTALPQLQWLDLRRNNLEYLPTDGLAEHENLETLLLQSNRIKKLPTELAFIPHLKGLQITGNPIENVPIEILTAGLPALLRYLKKMSRKHDIRQPVSETVIRNPSLKESLKLKDSESNNTVLSGKKIVKMSDTIETVLNVKSYNEKLTGLQPTTKRSGFKSVRNVSRAASSCDTIRRRYKSAFRNKLVTPEKIKINEERNKQRLRLKETLSKQSQMLQRFKDVEASKKWKSTKKLPDKKLLDNYQAFPSKNFAETTPFDIDQDMLKMLTREDIYLSLKEWEYKKRREAEKKSQKKEPRDNLREIEFHIKELTEQLKQLDFEINEEGEISRKKDSLSERMDQINKLRRTLREMHCKNLFS